MKEIKNIIFDLGGVVVDLEIERGIRAFARILAHPITDSNEAMTKLRPLMHAMDMGEMSGKEFVALMKRECREGTTDQDIVDAFNQIIRLPRHRLEWLARLKQRYNVFLLSNIGDLHWIETLRQTRELGFDMGDCFHQLFLSYQLRMAKPDPAIYKLLIERTGICPQETLYIDDLPDNITSGRNAGLQAYLIAMNQLDGEITKLFPEIL
ncbi:MAG: HAD family phosphatase [Bacteroidaceae bacterium]|nr:HAD family phosphatase [Bacteroidaceae bacterium]